MRDITSCVDIRTQMCPAQHSGCPCSPPAACMHPVEFPAILHRAPSIQTTTPLNTKNTKGKKTHR
ncbi:hypothetical protein BDQ12DRAFT_690091 [Crucibulum laeve]|uniref:Uncharacterized protein n=1 Tax=Crucibulum laeve TaxID=68775 RepID=A0A5C3LNB0_9AGAR|nr:hypothetical protein BDQ12DRAFT_690091 [Crucibulum laeve]